MKPIIAIATSALLIGLASWPVHGADDRLKNLPLPKNPNEKLTVIDKNGREEGTITKNYGSGYTIRNEWGNEVGNIQKDRAGNLIIKEGRKPNPFAGER